MTNKERMLHMVLDNRKLQDEYKYDESDYEDLYSALNSDNVVVATVARIIKDLDGSDEESAQKKVYNTIVQYLNSNLIL
jgi:signal recognition particle GTPase